MDNSFALHLLHHAFSQVGVSFLAGVHGVRAPELSAGPGGGEEPHQDSWVHQLRVLYPPSLKQVLDLNAHLLPSISDVSDIRVVAEVCHLNHYLFFNSLKFNININSIINYNLFKINIELFIQIFGEVIIKLILC